MKDGSVTFILIRITSIFLKKNPWLSHL